MQDPVSNAAVQRTWANVYHLFSEELRMLDALKVTDGMDIDGLPWLTYAKWDPEEVGSTGWDEFFEDLDEPRTWGMEDDEGLMDFVKIVDERADSSLYS
ncbi:hypothetical protein BV25DRAFT_1821388 [Artomyces pyxidatus]|uniref:Uncharacterized protein n=1 Tax=Artomyces pyxidatus TaxID=48021 RepID=A0ACB8TAY4_9AGAM|nr:hypothetical protein BV25DRAFT_1821388 [Artomyces pyxidatus]